MSQRSTTCVFCDKSDSPINKEHIFPEWIAKLPGLKNVWSGIRPIGKSSREPYAAKNSVGVVVRAPCERCNGGWMSALEGLVKPILGPMILGDRLALTAPQLTVLAQWTAKTAMMIDCERPARGYPRFFERRELHAFFRTRAMPHMTKLFVAARDINTWSVSSRAESVRFYDAPSSTSGPCSMGFVVTIAVATAALQLVTWRPPEGLMIAPPLGEGDARSTGVTEFWPHLTALAWPPRVPVPSVDTFHKRFINANEPP